MVRFVATRRLILIVQEDEDIARWMQARLEEAGFETDTVKDGLEALDWLGRRRPDLVLTTVMMPRMDGFELARLITSSPDAPPVVFCTPKAVESDRRIGLQAGATAYLVLPDALPDIVAHIRAILPD